MAEEKQTNQTLEELHRIAGGSLSKILDAYFSQYEDHPETLVRWFYDSNNKWLGKSPYEACKEGRQYELESIMMNIITGNGGG